MPLGGNGIEVSDVDAHSAMQRVLVKMKGFRSALITATTTAIANTWCLWVNIDN
jgi:hypothetical protein